MVLGREDDGGDRDSGAGPKKPAKPTIVTLVDPKTANNVGIAISRFKKSEAEIASAITDGSETAFTSDQLSSLLAILPSAEDVETVKGYEGDVAMLGKTEQFYLAIAGEPRFQIRTRCMLIRATFPEKEAELKEKLKAVSAAVSCASSAPSSFHTVRAAISRLGIVAESENVSGSDAFAASASYSRAR